MGRIGQHGRAVCYDNIALASVLIRTAAASRGYRMSRVRKSATAYADILRCRTHHYPVMLIPGRRYIIDMMNVTIGNLGVAHRLQMNPGIKCVMDFDPLNLQIFNKPKMCESGGQCRRGSFSRDREIRESDILQHGDSNNVRRIGHHVGIENLVVDRDDATYRIDRCDQLDLARMFRPLLGINLLIRIQQYVVAGVERFSIRWRDVKRIARLQS